MERFDYPASIKRLAEAEGVCTDPSWIAGLCVGRTGTVLDRIVSSIAVPPAGAMRQRRSAVNVGICHSTAKQLHNCTGSRYEAT